MLVQDFLLQSLRLFSLLLMIRILLSWFPTISWYSQPWRALQQITEPILAPLRNLVPPIMGGIDISPILAFLLLNVLQMLVRQLPF